MSENFPNEGWYWISKFRKLTDDQIKSTLKILYNTCYNKVAKIKEKMRSLQVAWGKNKQANKTKSWNLLLQFSSVQSLSRVRLFATPWTTARQASLSVTNSRSSPKSTSIELVMPSNRLILCHPLLLLPSIFPSIRVFSDESSLCIRYTGVSPSASVLPMSIQGWFPLRLTGLISLQSKGLSRVFSNTTFRRRQFFHSLPSLQSSCPKHTWSMGRR